jgi:hypothetical protein
VVWSPFQHSSGGRFAVRFNVGVGCGEVCHRPEIVIAAIDQDAFLFQRLDEAVSKYDSESKRLKRWSFSLRITILLLAALSTVLLGWNAEDNPDYLVWSRNAALAIGAVSTFLVGLSAFWNIETNWLKQKVLLARVRALRERCQFLQAKMELSSEEVEAAFAEYRAMMEDRIEYWEALASRKAPGAAIESIASGKS